MTDRLYQPDIMHPLSEASCQSSCDSDILFVLGCLIRDDDGDNSVIHYDLIALVNQLIKDVKFRD